MEVYFGWMGVGGHLLLFGGGCVVVDGGIF